MRVSARYSPDSEFQDEGDVKRLKAQVRPGNGRAAASQVLGERQGPQQSKINRGPFQKIGLEAVGRSHVQGSVPIVFFFLVGLPSLA